MQSDFSICNAWGLCALHKVMPKAFVAEAYQLHMSLMLSFLSKLDENLDALAGQQNKAYFDASTENQRVEAMTAEWLKYERTV